MARKSKPGRASRKSRLPALGNVEQGDLPALVVGLGNPGRKYRGTRHNAGFMAADRIIEGGRLVNRATWPDGELWLVEAAGRRFLVLKPATYMNLSGRAVAPLLKSYGLVPERMIVIHDDIDVPLGDVRTKKGGGTGGHRGLASLVEFLGDAGFTRIRVGVGRPPEGRDPAEYVLTHFLDGEAEQAGVSVEKAAATALDLLTGAEIG